jgi:phage/conjugal plasmid C-4 type zinc finger TraR family protein
MADLADHADLRIERETAARLQRIRAAARGPRAGLPALGCKSCGKPIPRLRLAALPNAARCLQCQIAAEQAPR